MIIADGAARYSCDLLDANAHPDALEAARSSQLIYYPLCGGRLYLRNPARGERTGLEAATEFLRQVWGGEKVVILFHHLLSDRYRESGEFRDRSPLSQTAKLAGVPLPASTDPGSADRLIVPGNLGVDLEIGDPAKKGMIPGVWYLAAGSSGISISVIQPNLIDPAILRNHTSLVNTLDSIEASSLCYLIAFDLDQFELGYALGTALSRSGLVRSRDSRR